MELISSKGDKVLEIMFATAPQLVALVDQIADEFPHTRVVGGWPDDIKTNANWLMCVVLMMLHVEPRARDKFCSQATHLNQLRTNVFFTNVVCSEFNSYILGAIRPGSAVAESKTSIRVSVLDIAIPTASALAHVLRVSYITNSRYVLPPCRQNEK
jgi:hypothetical protein